MVLFFVLKMCYTLRMKIRFLVFLLGIFLVFSANAQMVPTYGSANGGVAVPSMPQVGGVKVPTYEKATLPPTQEELDAQEEEKVEEDGTKQMIKGAAISAGVLVGANAIVKGFSTKHAKNSCLSQNTYKTLDLVEDAEWFYVWDPSLSFKKNESNRCLTCCLDPSSQNGTLSEDDRIEKLEECIEENPDDEDHVAECEDEYSVFNTTGCSTDGACEKPESLYNSQMSKYCEKNEGCLTVRD